MNPLQALKIYGLTNQLAKLNKEGAPAMKYLPVVTSLAVTLIVALAFPAFVGSHPAVLMTLAFAFQIGHILLPSIFPAVNLSIVPGWKYGSALFGTVTAIGAIVPTGDYVAHHAAVYAVIIAVAQVLQSALPSAVVPNARTSAWILVGLLTLGMCTVPAHAQTDTASTDPDQFFGVGPSLAVDASPMAAGTGLYAKKIANTSTYSVSVLDVTPNSSSPGTVNTNVGTGIGQKVAEFTIARQNVKLYATTEVGISWQGSNVGWAWTGGGMVPFTIKGHELAVAVRYNKSSVSNGTGYQLKPTILYCWKK